MAISGAAQLDFVVGELVLLDGRRQSDAVHMAVLTPPRRAAQDRRTDTLFVFLDLGGGGAGGLARAMLEQFGRAYWRRPGTVTSALRQAFRAANDHLQEENRLMAIGQRRRGGLICAVMHNNDLYLAQIGPARGLLIQGDAVATFPDDTRGNDGAGEILGRKPERLPLGVSSTLDIQFTYHTLHAGDRLLLTGESWCEEMPADALASSLKRERVEDVMVTLEQQARSGAFSALVLGCVPRFPTPPPQPKPKPQSHKPAAPVSPPVEPEPGSHRPPVSVPAPRPAPPAQLEPAPPAPAAWPVEQAPMYADADEDDGDQVDEYVLEPEPADEGWQLSSPLSGVSFPSERVAQAREGLRKAGRALGDGAHTLLTRVLPEPELAPAQRSRRARHGTNENVTMMAGIAVAIPLLVAFIVVTFYLQRSANARRDALVNRALEAAAAARVAEGDAALARWSEALDAAQEALRVVPGDREILAVRDEARATLDALSSTLRPDLVRLWDFGSGGDRRLAATRMQIFALDRAANQVTLHTLDQARQQVTEEQPARVAYRGEIVGEGEIGALRDAVWLETGGGWVGNALFILTEDNQLLQYSQQWGLSWVSLNLNFENINPYALKRYSGRLYILDREHSQLWRLPPSADGFGPPEGYFSAGGPDLSQAVDVAIDGAVYVLMADGTILRFFDAQPQPFELRDLPADLPFRRPVAMVSEGDAAGGALYVADADAQAVVALSKDGQFLFQLQAPLLEDGSADTDALAGLSALSLDESSRTLYLLARGRLYAMALPPLP